MRQPLGFVKSRREAGKNALLNGDKLFMKVAGLCSGTWESTWSKGCLLQAGRLLKPTQQTFTPPLARSILAAFPRMRLVSIGNSPGMLHGAMPPASPGIVNASPSPTGASMGLAVL